MQNKARAINYERSALGLQTQSEARQKKKPIFNSKIALSNCSRKRVAAFCRLHKYHKCVASLFQSLAPFATKGGNCFVSRETDKCRGEKPTNSAQLLRQIAKWRAFFALPNFRCFSTRFVCAPTKLSQFAVTQNNRARLDSKPRFCRRVAIELFNYEVAFLFSLWLAIVEVSHKSAKRATIACALIDQVIARAAICRSLHLEFAFCLHKTTRKTNRKMFPISSFNLLCFAEH